MKSRRSKYLLLILVVLFGIIQPVLATTIKETLVKNDGYDTVEANSFIIGVTKFSGNEVITAGKAATAGANDAMLYITEHGSKEGYKLPTIYYYVDSTVGWFAFDSDNVAHPVTDAKTLDKLSKLNIYYVNNVEKVLAINYTEEEIDTNSLTSGIEYKDKTLFVNATIPKFTVKTVSGNKLNYVMDYTVSNFVKDLNACYTVEKNIITDYDSSCGDKIVIPTKIDGVDIVEIAHGAFDGKGLSSVVIPKEITKLGSNAFANNSLKSVVVKDKYDESDFYEYGENVFGAFDNITYDNDLTRGLKLINDTYEFKVYSGLDTSVFEEDVEEYALILSKKFLNILKENGYGGFGNPWDDRDWGTDPDEIGMVHYWLDVSCDDIETCNVSLGRMVGVDYENSKEIDKDIKVNIVKSGSLAQKLSVDQAIKNIEIDTSKEARELVEQLNRKYITRVRYLENFVDNYDIDYMFGRLDGGSEISIEETNIDYGYYFGDFLVFKEDILYEISDEVVLIKENNNYESNLAKNDSEDDDAYVDRILEDFEEKTGITNYEVKLTEDGKKYNTNPIGTKKAYYINIFDIDYSEYWYVYVYLSFEDSYDENGKTSQACFTIEDGTITEYDGSCGANVKIPSTINGEVVEKIGDYVFYNYGDYGLDSVELPGTLKEIGNYTFSGNKLVEVEFSNSLEKIGYNAFSNNYLSSIEIPDSVVEIGVSTFSDNQITSVKFGSGLEVIESQLFNNNEIVKLEIPGNIKKISYGAFYKNKIEELNIAEGVENISSEAFVHNKIKKLILPNSLQNIEGGSFNDNQLSDEEAFIYGYEFYWDDNNEEAYRIDKTKIVSYGGANRDNIRIPNEVERIGYNAFSNLGLESIEIPYGVKSIESYAFYDNDFKYISVPDTAEILGENVFGDNDFEGDNCFIYARDEDGKIDYSYLMAYSSNYEADIDVIKIPKTVKKIGNYAINGYNKEIEVPYGVEEIGDYAFSNISVKTSMTLPNSIIKIGRRVFPNSGFDEVLPENRFVYGRTEDGNIDKTLLMGYLGMVDDDLIIPEGVVEIGDYVFYDKAGYLYGDEEAVKITLANTVKKIGEFAFAENNGRIKNIALNNGLETIDEYAFYYNTFTNVSFPASLKEIGNYAFAQNELYDITLHDGLEKIGDGSFSSNELKEIEIPSTIKNISKYAFAYNYELENVILNEGIEIIGDEAFNYSSIKEIDIPSSIKSIGTRAFGYDLGKVNVYGKTSLEEFEYLAEDAFNYAEYNTDNFKFINE